jgi:hypothetical protein
MIENVSRNGFACVSVNGRDSESFQLTQGSGQGDCLSSGQYVLQHHVSVMVVQLVLSRRSLMTVRLPAQDTKIPAQCYADDTSWIARLTRIADVTIWNSVWDTIARVTGLKINPTKTQIITLGPDCDIELLSLIGVVVPHAEHLGVYQSANPRAAYNLTYNKLIHKVKETVNRFIDLTSRADYIHKSMLIRALVNSQMLHVFRVYPPQEKEIKQLDKLVKQALWSKKYAGTLFGRVQIAASRVCAPLKWGGVNLACPRPSATQSFLSAFIAIIKHSLDYPDSMLNRIYKFTDKRLAISHWGSRSIKHEFDWLRRIIPNSWGGLQVLKESLGQMELDPTLAHHSSLWGSEYSYSLRKPPLFAFATCFLESTPCMIS